MTRTRLILAGALAPALMLAACQSDSDPAPGGVTRGEASALDQAAQDTDINAAGDNTQQEP